MQAVKVFLCGGKASGKTVYLSSLYKDLSVPNKEIGLRCETSAGARNRLTHIHNRLRTNWPAGTELGEQYEIPFSFFIVRSDNTAHLGTKVVFYDFAGEAVSGDGVNQLAQDRMEEIKELADSCDVVISVIDGVHIYKSLYENDGTPTPQLLDSIDAALSFWQSSGQVESELRQNNYFLITKWDLFDDKNESLEAVYDLLFSIDEIDKYVNRLDDESVVRIIPVSSVGKGFAEYHSDSDQMKIIAKRLGDPINVDIPIACIIPDLIDAELRRIREQLEREAETERQRSVPWWKRLMAFAGGLVERSDTLRRIVYDLGVNPHDIDRLASALQNPLIKTEQQRQQKLAEIASRVSSQAEASAVVHQYFSDTKSSFDQRYPSSLVRG